MQKKISERQTDSGWHRNKPKPKISAKAMCPKLIKPFFGVLDKADNVVFVWRDWCVLGLLGPRCDCGTTRDSTSDLGTSWSVTII